jgi:hypothetical protein
VSPPSDREFAEKLAFIEKYLMEERVIPILESVDEVQEEY